MSRTNIIPVSSGIILEKVCEYFYYNQKHKDATDVPDMEIPPDLCLDLLMAADYLNRGRFHQCFYLICRGY